MAQYRPMHRAHEYPRIARQLNSTEWQQAMQWAKENGLTNLDRGWGRVLAQPPGRPH